VSGSEITNTNNDTTNINPKPESESAMKNNNELTNTNIVDEDVQFAQYEAHEAVAALQNEIISSIERLAALYTRVAKLPAVIGKLNRGDIDGDDAQTLYGIRMLRPLPEDTEADVVGTILHQGNIFCDGEGETCIGWVVADVEARVQAIEEEIAKNPPPDNDWMTVSAPAVEKVSELVQHLAVDGKVGVLDHGDRVEIVPGDVGQQMFGNAQKPAVQQ